VRDARWKLANDGTLFDMKGAPFKEHPVAGDTTDAEALTARTRLKKILDEHPALPYSGG